MNNKQKYKISNNINKINKIKYSKIKVHSWSALGNDSWSRRYSELYSNCERMTMCAFIKKTESGYTGICMGSDDPIQSFNLESLMCTLDILLMNGGLELSDPFVVSSQEK